MVEEVCVIQRSRELQNIDMSRNPEEKLQCLCRKNMH